MHRDKWKKAIHMDRLHIYAFRKQNHTQFSAELASLRKSKKLQEPNIGDLSSAALVNLLSIKGRKSKPYRRCSKGEAGKTL